MFVKISHTDYPPTKKPMMVFDGNCGFCKYWIVKWMKITKLTVDYKPFQEIAHEFKDIPLDYFKSAVRYIDLNGKVTSGPDAAYITYYNQEKVAFLHRWYLEKKWFQRISDLAYQWIADHRDFMSKISIWLFGKNPANPKGYWKVYLGVLFFLLFSLSYCLLANI